MTPSFLLPALLLFSSPALAQDAAEVPVRVFVVEDLLSIHASTDGLNLFPRPFTNFEERVERGWGSQVELDDLVLFLRECVAPSLWDEPGQELRGTGRNLLVRAPEPVLDRIEALLDLLREQLLVNPRLQVRVIGGAGLPTKAVRMAEGAADQALQPLLEAGRARVQRVGSTGLVEGMIRRIDLVDTVSLTVDWQVEIAHAATIYDPVMEEVGVGLAAMVRSSRGTHGVTLDLGLRFSEVNRPPRERRWPISMLVGSGDPGEACVDPALGDGIRRTSVGVIEQTLLLESPEIDFTSLAGSLHLPYGEVMWIPFKIPGTAAGQSHLLELRLAGPPPAERIRVLRDIPDQVHEVTDLVPGSTMLLDFLGSGFGHAAGLDLAWFEDAGRVGLEPWSETISTWSRARLGRNRDRDILLRGILDLVSDDDTAPEQYLGGAVLQYPARQASRVEQGLAAFAPPVSEVRVDGRLLDGSESGDGWFSVPLVTGRPFAVWGGVEGSYLANWDVDVAGYAMIGNPEVASWFHGYALRLDVQQSGAAAQRVHVNGLLNLKRGDLYEAALGPVVTPGVERMDMERLVLDEALRLSDQDLGRPVLLGSSRLGVELAVEGFGGN